MFSSNTVALRSEKVVARYSFSPNFSQPFDEQDVEITRSKADATQLASSDFKIFLFLHRFFLSQTIEKTILRGRSRLRIWPWSLPIFSVLFFRDFPACSCVARYRVFFRISGYPYLFFYFSERPVFDLLPISPSLHR